MGRSVDKENGGSVIVHDASHQFDGRGPSLFVADGMFISFPVTPDHSDAALSTVRQLFVVSAGNWPGLKGLLRNS